MTPMQEQYIKIKSQYNGFIVLFRLGDFYETFNEDAVELSRVLGITLTSRGKDQNKTPLAGIPYHALGNYMPKMVEAGLRVVIAEQMEEAVPGKLVERQVTKVITPGTVMDENSLDASRNNYIGCISKSKSTYNFTYCDLTTGQLLCFSTEDLSLLKLEVLKINPSEIVTSQECKEIISRFYSKSIEVISNEKFDFNYGQEVLLNQLGVLSLKGFGLQDSDSVITSAGALVLYLKQCQKEELKHIKSIKKYKYNDYMSLDPETIRNLELIYSNTGNEQNTVYTVINRTTTAMGKRLLRRWLLYPLINSEILSSRYQSVNFFFNNPIVLNDSINLLKQVSDVERICGRIGTATAMPRDLIALKHSLEKILLLFSSIDQKGLPQRIEHILKEFSAESELFNEIKSVINLIELSIDPEPPSTITEVGIIKEGYNSEIDGIKNLRRNSKNVLAQMQIDESAKTGISSLKISFNQVFGYYIEITKTHLQKVPNHYIRKQTLANAERYITQELKELEDKILSSEERLLKLEQSTYFDIRNKVAENIPSILELAEYVAEIDCYLGFAKIAKENRYTMPIIKNNNSLKIINGRHLVVEKLVSEFTFNSTDFNSDIVHILTGPNMSGKSTYIRQVALIALIAQIGSFVPADLMEFSILDRIFTRVGATDNLSKGESTFMVEMNETANILNNATQQSLIILDEVGRGTSTYDGVAIAWSIIEYIVENLKSKTLFATHYHELVALENKYKEVSNYNVEVLDVEGQIYFKHKIVKGGTSKSYGLHVAKLAGVPSVVLDKADAILESFEKQSQKPSTKGKVANSKLAKPKELNPGQLGLI